MSDEPAPDPKPPAKKGATRVRRVSNPRPKKAAKTTKAKVKPLEDDASRVENPPTSETAAVETPSAVETPVQPETATPETPEETPAKEDTADQTSSEDALSQNTAKRKRRRKKSKGPQDEESPGSNENRGDASNEASTSSPQRQNQRPRPKVDPELLSKRAWKIFLAEVSEEGVALVGDNDARELSRRCFRLAEIFLEEQGRRR